MNAPGYEKLAAVLTSAFEQAAVGKGAERHANDLPFHDQPMQQIADRRGIGFILGQADKKSEEAQGMLDRGARDAAIRELLGAIVYLAGSVIFIQRHGESSGAEPEPANDNRILELYDNRPVLPVGFMPWEPEWIEKGVAAPPAPANIDRVMLSNGTFLPGNGSWHWGNAGGHTVVGYKLHG